jgi:hypothetical protein
MKKQKPTVELNLSRRDRTNPDALAHKYLYFKQRAEESSAALKELKDLLVKLVKRKGFIPPDAEKSKRIETVMHEITATFGECTKVNYELARSIRNRCMIAMGEEAGLRFLRSALLDRGSVCRAGWRREGAGGVA